MIDWWYRFLKPKNYIDLKHCFSKGYKDIHICDLAKIITGISADFNPYKHNTILKKIIYDDLSPEEMR